MTKPRLAFSAFVVGLAALAARAQDKSADVSVSAPSMAPGAPATPSLPGQGSVPSLSVGGEGADVSTPQTQAGGSAAVAAPAVAAPVAQTPAASPSAPAAQPRTPAAPLPSAGTPNTPPAVRRQLDSTVTQVNAGQSQGAAAGAVNSNGIFRRIYDQGRASVRSDSASPSGPAGAVIGRDEPIADRVDQIAFLARTASPYEAPGLYEQALGETRQAAKDRKLDAATARNFVATLFGFAAPQGRQAIPRLAQAAAEAGPAEAAKPLKAIKDWDKLIDLFGKPPMRRDARTQALVSIALDHVKVGAIPPAGERAPDPTPASGDSPVKAISSLRVGDAAREAAIPELGESWLDDVLAAHSRNPGADPILLYQLARRGAGLVVPAAAASAASQAARTWLMQAWQWLRQLYLRALGPQAAVELGGGLTVRGPASEVSGLGALTRAGSAYEKELAAGQRAAVVPVDLSSVEAPYAAAMRLLSSEAPMSAPRLEKLLAQGETLALASRRLTGDPSGVEAYGELRARLTGQSELGRVDARLLGYWLGTLREAALSRVEAAALDGARRGGPVVLSDPAKEGLLIVAASPERGEPLARLGFDVSARPGAVLARLSLAGLDADARREALAAAVSVAAGHDVSAVPVGAARVDAATMLAFVRSNPGLARSAALQLKDEEPFIRRRFELVGRVSTPEGRFLLERSRREVSGRLEIVDVLRGESGRAAFARKTFAPAR